MIRATHEYPGENGYPSLATSVVGRPRRFAFSVPGLIVLQIVSVRIERSLGDVS
jgi:hypothetical protein